MQDNIVPIAQTLQLSDFFSEAESLGTIIHVQNIKLESGSKKAINSPKEVDFHTDSPEADYVGWYCLKPCSSGLGALQFKDLSEVFDHLAPETIKTLNNTKMPYPIGAGKFSQYRILSDRKVYFAPWYLVERSAETRELSDYIESRKIREVLLREQQSVFVNNNYVLHGRAVLPENSDRHLIRVWIKK